MTRLTAYTRTPEGEPVSTPFYAFGTFLVFVVALVVLIVTGNAKNSGMFIAVAVSTIPSLVAAMFAERVSRDVRNGTIVRKTKQGTHEALAELVADDTPVGISARLAAMLDEAEQRHVNDPARAQKGTPAYYAQKEGGQHDG